MTYRRKVQFYETDLAGMVHFSWYFRYMEEAEHALWRAAGLTIASPDDDLRYPRVAASCEYRAPLRFEDDVMVDVRVTPATPRTLRYDFTLSRGDTLVATGTMTVACVRTGPATPAGAVEIPASIREKLSAAAARVSENHT